MRYLKPSAVEVRKRQVFIALLTGRFCFGYCTHNTCSMCYSLFYFGDNTRFFSGISNLLSRGLFASGKLIIEHSVVSQALFKFLHRKYEILTGTI